MTEEAFNTLCAVEQNFEIGHKEYYLCLELAQQGLIERNWTITAKGQECLNAGHYSHGNKVMTCVQKGQQCS